MLGREDWTEVTGRYRVGYGRTDKQSLKSCASELRNDSPWRGSVKGLRKSGALLKVCFPPDSDCNVDAPGCDGRIDSLGMNCWQIQRFVDQVSRAFEIEVAIDILLHNNR